MPQREPGVRVRDFAQVGTGLSEPQMKSEAIRCMECGCGSVFECDLKRHSSEYDVDIARFAGEVRRHRVDRSHPRMTLEEAVLFRHLATFALGTTEVGSFGQNQRGGPRNDLDDMLGETTSTCVLDDLGTADVILLAGADPSATHPVLAM